jgi:hypothetical protein
MAKTLKVRIPAVVSSDGKWCAYGYPGAMKDPDWSMVEEVADNGEASFDYKRMWITVELPVPDVEEVDALFVTSQ